MARVQPQPGGTYKVICADDKTSHKEVIFKFINVVNSGQLEIEVDGKKQTVSDFCVLCSPWACEVHDI